MSFVPRDVIILPESSAQHPDRWVAMNVFARTSLGVTSPVLALLGHIGAGEPAQADTQTYQCWDIEYFSNEEGLLADPSRFRRDPAQWRGLTLDRAALEAKLKAHCILIDDEDAYRLRFQAKRHLLDREHFGNFHQQHGQHMMLTRRTDPGKWWMDQKFTPDRREVRQDNLYGAVQWSFLEGYFQRRIRAGMHAVDVGCGTGIYSNLMASFGAEVTGIDPSEEYLAVARANALPGTQFLQAAIGEPHALAALPDACADLVFMSDALLFYFVPFYPGQKADMKALLDEVRRILKPGGTFVSLEPHAVFYHAPWLGEAQHPFTVVSEYTDKRFGIVPTFSWLVHALAGHGFAVTDAIEPGPAEAFAGKDPRAYHFAREFPVWQLLELQVLARR
jgi:SAM-dependent methyltransferase